MCTLGRAHSHTHAQMHSRLLLGLTLFYYFGEATGFFTLQWASLILCDAPVVQQEDSVIYSPGSGSSLVTFNVEDPVLFNDHSCFMPE